MNKIKTKHIFILFCLMFYIYCFFNTQSALAQVPVATLGPITGPGPYGEKPPQDVIQTGASVAAIFSLFLGLFTVLGGLLTFMELVLGGLSWSASGGDKANLEKARNQITNGVIGLVIIVASWAIIITVGTIFGLEIAQPQKALQSLFGSKTQQNNTTSPPLTSCPSGYQPVGNDCCNLNGRCFKLK